MLDELRRSPLFTPAAKLVGWEIVQCVDEAVGYAWPKEETLAEWLSIDKRTVRRAVQELEQKSVMVVQRVHRRVHHYIVPYLSGLADKLSGKQAAPAAVDRTRTHSKVDKKCTSRGGQKCTSNSLKDPLFIS